MHKSITLKNILEKTPLEIKKQLNLKNRNFIDINNDILKFQHYINLLKAHKGRDMNYDLELYLNDLTDLFRKQSISQTYVKIRKDINQINSHIYNYKNKSILNDFNNTTQDNKRFIDKFNIIINSSSYIPKNKIIKNSEIMSLKVTHPINSYRKKEKNKYIKIKIKSINKDINKRNKMEKIRNNTTNNISDKKINKTRIKVGYGNYAFPNINYNHPQYYKLNNISKEKFPPIICPNINKKRKPNDLSESISFDNKKNEKKFNFYNYYIGLKLKYKFN